MTVKQTLRCEWDAHRRQRQLLARAAGYRFQRGLAFCRSLRHATKPVLRTAERHRRGSAEKPQRSWGKALAGRTAQ